MLLWLVVLLVAGTLAGIAAACYLARERPQDPPRLDEETRERLDDWTED